MAQVWTTKQANWTQRFSNNVTGFLANLDAINLMITEATNDGYLSGQGEVLPDSVVQTILPAATAAAVFSAVGAFANSGGISAVAAASRQSLELMRP